jgi:hypothetical protein
MGRRLGNEEKSEKFPKKLPWRVDDSREWDIFVIPQEAGLHQSRDNGSWFSQILGLQIGTQFCPGMRNPARREELSSAPGLSFFDARKLRQPLVL